MAPGKIQTTDVHNVFQAGLVRGVERSRLNPRKQYFYVEHPEEGWRVYLRAACFIHDWADAGNRGRILVVKRTGGDPDKKVWEMPKGQMEGKDAGEGGPGSRPRPLMQLLKENMRREVAEEAKIHHVREMHHTGLVLQSVEPDYPEGTFFQYHVFSGYAHPSQVQRAEEEFAWLADHPDAFRRLRSDQREKDAIAWYDEGPAKKMMGRWSPTLLRLYLEKGGAVTGA